MKNRIILLSLFVFLSMLFSACSTSAAPPEQPLSATEIPTEPPVATETIPESVQPGITPAFPPATSALRALMPVWLAIHAIIMGCTKAQPPHAPPATLNQISMLESLAQIAQHAIPPLPGHLSITRDRIPSLWIITARIGSVPPAILMV